MVFGKLFEPFIAGSPVSVMFRGTLENLLAAERLDRIFESAAQKQTCRDLAFSTCADLLGMVVTRIRRSVNAAYRAHREAITVSVQAVYDKLAGIEPVVSEALVRETARDLSEIQAKMHASWPGPLPGLEVRIADGNHLALRTAHGAELTDREKTGKRARLSFYYLADEIAGVWRGMALVIPAQKWTAAFARQSPQQMATILLWLAQRTKIDYFLANSYGKKKRKKPRPMTTRGGHVSTYRILQERKLSHVRN